MIEDVFFRVHHNRCTSFLYFFGGGAGKGEEGLLFRGGGGAGKGDVHAPPREELLCLLLATTRGMGVFVIVAVACSVCFSFFVFVVFIVFFFFSLEIDEYARAIFSRLCIHNL
jgi:hypothetical protein